MKLKLFFTVVTLFCTYIFSSCTKIGNAESVTNKVENNSENSLVKNLTISQNPIEIFQRTKLTDADLSQIQSRFGQVDINSFHSRAYSESVAIYSTIIHPLQNSKSIVCKLMITDQFINNKHILITYVGSVESFDKNIDVSTNTSQIINGKTTLFCLNTGINIESIIQGKVDKGVTATNSSFPACFSDCVFSFVSDMSWLERAICLIDLELCLPGVTVGCTIRCVGNS